MVGGSIPPAPTLVTAKFYPARMPHASFLGVCRGLSQYGDLHFGQTVGFFAGSRGGHSCPHRSHTKNVFRIVPMRPTMYLPGIYVKYQITT